MSITRINKCEAAEEKTEAGHRLKGGIRAGLPASTLLELIISWEPDWSNLGDWTNLNTYFGKRG